MKAKDIYLETEGDAWFERNRNAYAVNEASLGTEIIYDF